MAKDQGSAKEAVDTQDKSTTKESKLDTPPVEESKEDAQAEISRKAAKLGESRKQAFSALVKAAKTSEEAKQELIELSKDEYNSTYLKDKFGKEYTSLVAEPEKEENIAVENLAKTVEKLSQDQQARKSNRLTEIKSQIGLTLDEEDEFNDLVSTFDGATIGGKVLTFEDALEKAAKQIKPRAKFVSVGRSNVIKRPEDKGKEVKVPLTDERIRKNSFHTGAKSADDFKDIHESFEERGSYKIPISFNR